ncbi:hypothetical protein [Xenorhabdus thuongxuanensis]|uniref:hypothetical protein n=1 Tax=Xenorhabdus thuongxuanensis TaxID=1873484 RepID=UPI000B160604|nr:hypothetical protein [Xenorhabdus thuongxuanensis]
MPSFPHQKAISYQNRFLPLPQNPADISRNGGELPERRAENKKVIPQAAADGSMQDAEYGIKPAILS